METLTDRQKSIAQVLVTWAREHAHGTTDDLLIDEDQLSHSLGDLAWIRQNTIDLGVLCAYCDRKQYPMIPLLVVIPGLRKPEKYVFTHAFKATLSSAENDKRWKEELNRIVKTEETVWEEIASTIKPEVGPKKAKAKTEKPVTTKPKRPAKQGPSGESLAEKAFRLETTK